MEKKEKKPEVKAMPVKNERSRSLPERKKPQEEKKADKKYLQQHVIHLHVCLLERGLWM